ncbi:hypothetical protein I3843_01G020100 [Carya illinoinensis]|uniref:Uncharacterized protein n=1 Tax=Carya illinoinensis TaxID=32201 RepID=A0A922FYV8_CARIL|nr:hypothetical protein I3842_01G021000 [Carya illinoinensis]KAG7993739.1 hypothetical protein I3843_01G020100 [Carya illinoinensis]
MESYQPNKTRDLVESCGSTLEAKTVELMKTREEVKTAKERTTQSWLDSRPFIDELERLKSSLASAQNQSIMSNTIISKLESQLRSTITSIKSKKEEERNAKKMIIETSQTLNHIHDEQQAKLTVKQLESEAFGASAAEAVHLINCSEKDNTIIQLSHEHYHALTRRAEEETRRAEEETSLADQRASVSTQQKLVAQASQNLALTRLKDSNPDSKLGAGFTKQEAEKQNPSKKLGGSVDDRRNAFIKAQAKPHAPSNHGKPPQQFRRSKSNNNKRPLKKKASILQKIRIFISRKITRLFR